MGDTYVTRYASWVRASFFALVLNLTMVSSAGGMEFSLGGTDHRAKDAAWIQAEGTIDENSLAALVKFLDEGPDWLPRRIRLNSPGGNLLEGVRLGEEFRRLGFATEVGGHEPHPDWPSMPYWAFTRRTPGTCSSACAYAFMGGIERRIDPGSRIGVHQFYRRPRAESVADREPALVMQGVEQRLGSILLDYILRMGVDPKILVYAGLAGPEGMHWISSGIEAEETRISYDPSRWQGWRIELLEIGVVAQSDRADGNYRMSAHCSKSGGAYLDLFIFVDAGDGGDWDLRSWLVDQCLPAGSLSEGPAAHRVLGNRVETSNVRVVDRSDGFQLRFPLGSTPRVYGPPSFLHSDTFGACITDRFVGTVENMEPALKIAFRNCID